MGWYDPSWSTKVIETSQNAKVDEAGTNASIILDDLDATFWADVKNGGGDIRVTKADGTTEVAREVVYCDTGTEKGELKIDCTGIQTGSDVSWCIYVGNPAASDYAEDAEFGREAVYDVNYLGVLHMNDITTGTIGDSTSNDNDGAKIAANNPLETASGPVGKAQVYAGDDYIDMANEPWSNEAQSTIEVIFKSGTTGSTMVLYFEGSSSSATPYFLLAISSASNEVQVQMRGNSGTIRTVSGSTDVLDDVKHHIQVVRNAENIDIIIDGVEETVYDTDSGGPIVAGTFDTATIGARRRNGEMGGGNFFTGDYIDELRISDTNRSLNYAKTRFNEMDDNSTFWDSGASVVQRTWGGGTGMDGDWSTGASWTSDTKPAAGENVLFDGTDVTNCDIDENTANLASLTATAAYTGTLDGATSDSDVNVAGDVTLACSAASGGTGLWTVGGDWDSFGVPSASFIPGFITMTGTAKTFKTGTTAARRVGTLTIDAGATIANANGSRSNNLVVNGEFDLDGNNHTIGANLTIGAAGNLTGAGQLQFSSNFVHNGGTVDVGTFTHVLNSTGKTWTGGGDLVCSAVNLYSAGANRALIFSAGPWTFCGPTNIGGSIGTLNLPNDTNDPVFVFKSDVTFTSAKIFAYTAGAGTITLSGATAGTQDIAFDGTTIEALIINDAGATKRIGANGFMTAALTLTAGTIDNATNDPNYAVIGAVSFAAGVTYTRGAGTISLFGATAGSQTIDFAGKTIESLDVNDAGATKVFSATGFVTTDLTLTAGTMDCATNDPSYTAAGISLAAGATYTKGTGTITLAGSGAGTQDIDFAGKTVESITMNDVGSTKRVSATGLTTVNLILTAGTWDNATNDPSYTVSGNISFAPGVIHNEGAGTLTLAGAGAGTQTIDFNGDTMEALVVNDAGAIKQFTNPASIASITGTAGTIDPNGESIVSIAAWNMAIACNVAVGGLPGSSLLFGANSDWDTVNLNSAGAWAITVAAGVLTIHNSTIANCDASGGIKVDATDNCVDGGGNNNIDFGGASSRSWIM